MNFQKRLGGIVDRLTVMSREVNHIHMDLLVALVDHNIGEEGNELGRYIPLRGPPQHLASFGNAAYSDKVP